MRPVRECSQEREKTEQTWDPIQTLSLAHECHTWCKNETHLNSTLETGERSTSSWWWYFYFVDHTIMFTRLRESEMRLGVNLISIDCTALGAASCSRLALESPSQPPVLVSDTKGSRMLQSLLLSWCWHRPHPGWDSGASLLLYWCAFY